MQQVRCAQAISPELTQLMTHPRDHRKRESIRHLHRWCSQRKLAGLQNPFPMSVDITNVHGTLDYVCAWPDT